MTKAHITQVSPNFGNADLVQPDGIQVFGTGFVKNDFFRCLFAGSIETLVLTWDTDSVFCAGPPSNSPISSSTPETIQILNDRRYYAGVSNSLPFTITVFPSPVVSFINPTSSDRYCSRKSCPPVYVYGHSLGGASKIECVFFGTMKTVGNYAGVIKVNGNNYDRVICPSIPDYTQTQTGPVTMQQGFNLYIYHPNTIPVSSNAVPWTYTCSPCDH